jgi:hypothetical protein
VADAAADLAAPDLAFRMPDESSTSRPVALTSSPNGEGWGSMPSVRYAMTLRALQRYILRGGSGSSNRKLRQMVPPNNPNEGGALQSEPAGFCWEFRSESRRAQADESNLSDDPDCEHRAYFNTEC